MNRLILQRNTPVVSLKTLLKMKRAAGRPQDLADITDLKRIKQLKMEFP
jgi:uncharacterized protein YihD (DUF1040 family)